VAAALVACHERGIIHRDLKPHNILVERETQRPVLVDFGLAKPDETPAGLLSQEADAGPAGPQLTRVGAVIGTPSYMPPEQADSQSFGTQGPHSDVWGFGATLFYCLTGETPYAKTGGASLLVQLVEEEPRDVTEVDPNVPPGLAELCRRCLTKDAEQRPTMVEVEEALARELAGRAPRSANLVMPALAGLIVLAGASLAGFLVLRSPPPRLESLDELPTWTTAEEIRVAGKASPGAKVFLERTAEGGWVLLENAELGQDGRFGWAVALEPGANELRLRVDGDPAPRALSVGRDVKEPVLKLDHRVTPGYLLPPPGVPPSGRIVDDTPCTLTVSGADVPLDEEGGFVIPAGGERLKLVVEDAAGRRVETEVSVLPSALTPLLDRDAWQRTPERAQDEALEAAAGLLGESYRYLGAEVFRCGDLQHRLGVFEHSPSGILLHLLPGDELTVGLEDIDLAMAKAVEAVNVEFEFAERIGMKHPWRKDRSVNRNGFHIESPPKQVSVRPLLAGRTEVLRREWAALGGADRGQDQVPPTPTHPQWWISYDHVVEWLERAGDGLRLPSEAEFEYACRAGSRTLYFWGDEPDYEGRYDSYWLSVFRWQIQQGYRSPVYQVMAVDTAPRLPNAFGLVDMQGNLWEYCADAWAGDRSRVRADGRPWGDPKARFRSRNGGGFNYGGPGFTHPSARGASKREEATWATGFRVYRSLLPD
jgi:formylglycine-generating enzyme required for sulfatase activity